MHSTGHECLICPRPSSSSWGHQHFPWLVVIVPHKHNGDEEDGGGTKREDRGGEREQGLDWRWVPSVLKHQQMPRSVHLMPEWTSRPSVVSVSRDHWCCCLWQDLLKAALGKNFSLKIEPFCQAITKYGCSIDEYLIPFNRIALFLS